LKHWQMLDDQTLAVSRPARGAWIETTISGNYSFAPMVAPREGRVD